MGLKFGETMEIYIIRHGQTVWNKQRKLQGSTDIELTEEGKRLATLTGEGLKGIAFDKVFSSPLKRAYVTAQLIHEGSNIIIETDERIKEVSFGEFEGMNVDEMLSNEECGFYHFFDKPELYRPAEHGERLEDVILRGKEFIEDKILPLEGAVNRVMIVAHGAMNKALLAAMLGREIKDFWEGNLQKNLGASIVELTNGEFILRKDSLSFISSTHNEENKK